MRIIDPEVVSKMYAVGRRPSVIGEMVIDKIYAGKYKREIQTFVNNLKALKLDRLPHDRSKEININKLCCLEDFDNPEMKTVMLKFKGTRCENGYIHRKDWEWALGVIAMKRLGKLGEKNTAIGIGSGKETVLFYLANNLKCVVATDLYEGGQWGDTAPKDFPTNPAKYSEVEYNKDNLKVLRMDGTEIGFPPNSYDITFSFSSIEHFGGEKHSGALRSAKEMERVLRPGGIAVIATEYIINHKEHEEFFNQETIYSHLVDKLDKLKLIEPLDLTVTSSTLNKVIDYFPTALNWNHLSDRDKKINPHIVIRKKDILYTSLMIVFKKI